MKNRFVSLLEIAALVLVLGSPMSSSAQTVGGQGQGNAGRLNRQGRERHPAIRQAIQALERAKADMQHANHDFGGHRAEALEACNNAIRQLQAALNYDKK